jgi:hypothetical protein
MWSFKMSNARTRHASVKADEFLKIVQPLLATHTNQQIADILGMSKASFGPRLSTEAKKLEIRAAEKGVLNFQNPLKVDRPVSERSNSKKNNNEVYDSFLSQFAVPVEPENLAVDTLPDGEAVETPESADLTA